MITNPNPILAVYEADVHCIACAEQRFGQSLYDAAAPVDAHGETVSLAYSWSYEAPREGEYCGTCYGVIIEPYDDDD